MSRDDRLAEVVRHLATLRDDEQGVATRARAVADAAGMVRELAPEDKRELALRIAERAAPDLVPKIREETGMDLTDAQVRAVIDMFRRLDDTDIAALARTAATGDASRDREDDEAPNGETRDGEPRDGETRDEEGPVDEGTRDTPADGAVAPTADGPPAPGSAPIPGHPEVDTSHLAELRAEVADLEDRRRSLADQQVPTGPETSDGDSRPPVTEPVDAPSSVDVDALFGEVRARSRGVGAEPTGAADPETAAAAPTLLRRLTTASTGHERVALVEVAGEDLAQLSATDRAAVLRAVPDGWARRRALQRMLATGVVPAAEAPDLLALLGRAGDRRFIVADMLADGLVDAGEITGLVDARTLALLLRRGATTG